MLKKLSNRIWFLEPDFRSDRPALGYIRGEKQAFAVDAGASAAHVKLFYDNLLSAGLPLPDMTGISHYHWDHSYGTAFLHGVSIASELCNEVLRRESSYVWSAEAMRQRLATGEEIKFSYFSKLAEYDDPSQIQVSPATISLQGSATVDLGGVTVQILACGGPHSDDSLMFCIPEEKFLFLGDASGKELFTLDWDYDETHPELLQDTLATLPFNREKLQPFVALLETIDFTSCLFAHCPEPWSRETLLNDLKQHLS